ncbi:MAG: hypothetical protein HGA67_03720 [Candidatus Yonathbacteria bacterium]|nr:hypothetical protein [Candidatus Yonathbacteria bacterium]
MVSTFRHSEQVIDIRRIATMALGGTAVVLVCAYVYLVNASVLSVVGREHAEESSSEVATDVVALEAEYLALSETVTMDEARALGFVEPKGTLFASRIADTRVAMR